MTWRAETTCSRPGRVLRKSHPCEPSRFQPIDNVRRLDCKAADAISRDSIRAAAKESNIVWFAGMSEGRISRCECIFASMTRFEASLRQYGLEVIILHQNRNGIVEVDARWGT